MTWLEANLSLQLMAEERIGSEQRERVRNINAQQEAAADAMREGIG